jgi:DNA-binding transcriptional ArsR family regulator
MNTIYKKYAPFFKVLSDANRLMIIDMLSCGELCACVILEKFNFTQPTLSHHMKTLCDCGLVLGRKEGKWMYYSLNQKVIQECKAFLSEVTSYKENCICTEEFCCDESLSNNNVGRKEAMVDTQVGILACSGEECLGGTISRLATRRVIETLRPNRAVTLCLPLYIAGGEEERNFAKEHPVITVEGCSKCCAVNATEKFSGKVRETVNIEDILGKDTALSKIVSARDMTVEHMDMIKIIARSICTTMDAIV